MLAIITPILIIFSLLFEIIVFRHFVRKTKKIKRIIFITIATAIPLLLITVFSAYTINPTPLAMGLMTWAVWVFLLNLIIKLLLSLAILINVITRKKHRWTAITATTLSVLIATIMIYGVVIGRNNIRIENIEIESSEIPESFNGYRIVQFSDTHIGNLMATNILENMSEKIASLDPDLIVQSGDLVNIHYKELTNKHLNTLLNLNATDGVVAVLGNHDLGFYLADTTHISPRETFDSLRAIQRNSLKWKLLENENLIIRRGDDSIVVSGVTYPKNLNHNNFNSLYGGSDLKKAMEGVKDSSFSILISHSPKLFDSIPSVARPDLTLSGHVHSMQSKISIGNWQWSPAKWLYTLYSGFYKVGEYSLYVNDGMGYVLFPMRLGARPELTVITLKHKPTQQ